MRPIAAGCAAAIFTVFHIFATATAQPTTQLLDDHRRDLLHEALSGEIAKDHVIQITRHHRIQGSRGYRDAARYVADQLQDYGFSDADAYIESFQSDGKILYQTWQSPSGWHVESAELRMLEPRNERIVGYPEIAMSLITYSNAGEATGELVWVGGGTRDADYAGVDVRDKIVLATGYGGSVHRLAVLKYGAKAVVCYLDDDRAKEYPDMLRYTGMWPKTEELDRVTFGFNLTNRQGEMLRELLGSGEKVVVQGKVRGPGLESYFMDVVVAHIRGSDANAGEIVFSAHLDHPKESANDNASGSAALLDIARAVNGLIADGRLLRPKRSLRFLWVPEWYGTMAYIDKHPELKGPALGGRFLANLNMDMVGEHLELLHSKLKITRTPDSMPSALNDVIANMTEMVDGMDIRTPRGSLSAFNYRITPYSGGSDHMMFIDRKIPGVMFTHTPDYTHHTSEDTPDKVDPVQLERCELIAAGTALYLASLNSREAETLAHLTASGAAARLAEAAVAAHRTLQTKTNGARAGTAGEAANMLRGRFKREKKTIGSVLSFFPNRALEAKIASMQLELRRQYTAYLERLGIAEAVAPSTPPDGRVPVRLTRGPLDFGLPESRLPEDRAAWYGSPSFGLSGSARFELVNFIDGKTTVSDIRDALSAEFGPVPLPVVARYLDDLVSIEVLGWR